MKIVVLLILTAILSGCATVETWEGLAREKIVIKDVGVSCSNDVACAVNVTGERHVSVAPSVVMCWDGSYRERFDVCHSNDFRVVTNECHLGKVDLKNSDSHLVVVSAEQWKDDAYLSREVLQGRDKCDFGIVVVDLNRWRRYLAIPHHKCDLPSGRVEWSFVVLREPVIDFYGGFYIRKENDFRVAFCRTVYTPFAVVLDVLTLPFQMGLGMFTHM